MQKHKKKITENILEATKYVLEKIITNLQDRDKEHAVRSNDDDDEPLAEHSCVS
jgi:hypothetical protein